jgi:hypothetical protein
MTAADPERDADAAPEPAPGRQPDRAIARLLRWYPRAWRERYGDEFLAMVEDTLDGRGPGWRLHLSVAKAGLRERGRRAAPAVLRKMAADASTHQSLDPAGWSAVTALIYFWSAWNGVQIPFAAGADREAGGAVPVAVGVIAGLGAVIGISVTIAGLVAGPALVRLLRAGGWPVIRQPVARAAVVTLAFAGMLTRFLLMISPSRHPALGVVSFAWLIATLVLLELALLFWRRAGSAMMAQGLDLRPRVRAVQVMLNAITMSASLAVLPVVLIRFGQAEHSGWFMALALLTLVGRGYAVPYRLRQAWILGRQLRAGTAGDR